MTHTASAILPEEEEREVIERTPPACPPLDAEGNRRIDPEAIEQLEKECLALPQTKDLHRDASGKLAPERLELHDRIIAKYEQGHPCVEHGQPIAILTGGPPGSGKSHYLKKIARWVNPKSVLWIDADVIREEFPEYKGWNAGQVHDETRDVVNRLLDEIGHPCKYDLVYDGTMNRADKYTHIIKRLRRLGYAIYLIYVNVPEELSRQRVLDRYQRTGRYVDSSVIKGVFQAGSKPFDELRSEVDGWVMVDGTNGEVMRRGGDAIPSSRVYAHALNGDEDPPEEVLPLLEKMDPSVTVEDDTAEDELAKQALEHTLAARDMTFGQMMWDNKTRYTITPKGRAFVETKQHCESCAHADAPDVEESAGAPEAEAAPDHMTAEELAVELSIPYPEKPSMEMDPALLARKEAAERFAARIPARYYLPAFDRIRTAGKFTDPLSGRMPENLDKAYAAIEFAMNRGVYDAAMKNGSLTVDRAREIMLSAGLDSRAPMPVTPEPAPLDADPISPATGAEPAATVPDEETPGLPAQASDLDRVAELERDLERKIQGRNRHFSAGGNSVAANKKMRQWDRTVAITALQLDAAKAKVGAAPATPPTTPPDPAKPETAPVAMARFGEPFTIPIGDVHRDVKRFQGRKTAFGEATVARILRQGYDPSLSTLKVWRDADGKLYLLAGYSRYEAASQLGVKELRVQEFTGDAQAAQDYALLESNRQGQDEGLASDVSAYIRMRDAGKSKGEMLDVFKKEAKVQRLETFSHLDPKGRFMEMLTSDAGTSFAYLERNAGWVGSLRSTYPQLSNQHEAEIFEHIYLHGGIKLPKDKLFKQVEGKIARIDFDPEKPLNFEGGVSTSAYTDPAREEVNALKLELERTERTMRDKRASLAEAKAQGLDSAATRLEGILADQQRIALRLNDDIVAWERRIARAEQNLPADLFSARVEELAALEPAIIEHKAEQREAAEHRPRLTKAKAATFRTHIREQARDAVKSVPAGELVKHGAHLLRVAQSIQAQRRYWGIVDKGMDNKRRLALTKKNLVRWAKDPGQYDLVGIDTYRKRKVTVGPKAMKKAA